MGSKVFRRILSQTPSDSKIFVRKSLDIAKRISDLIGEDKTQKWLAAKLGKSEAEISKWLSGTHNFTLKTIAKIEAVLEQEIIRTFPRVPIDLEMENPVGFKANIQSDLQVIEFDLHDFLNTIPSSEVIRDLSMGRIIHISEVEQHQITHVKETPAPEENRAA
jgi:transcriptional regulator with XRE-family HTH domain